MKDKKGERSDTPVLHKSIEILFSQGSLKYKNNV